MTTALLQATEIRDYEYNLTDTDVCDFENLIATIKEYMRLNAREFRSAFRNRNYSFYNINILFGEASYTSHWSDRVNLKSRHFLREHTFNPIYKNAEGKTGSKELFDLRREPSKLIKRVRDPRVDYTGSQVTKPLDYCVGHKDRIRTYNNFLGVKGGEPFTICSELEAYHILEWI